MLYNSEVDPKLPLAMPLNRSSRILILMATLIPTMVFSSGCMGLLFPHGFYPRGDCCNVFVVDDPSYRTPPQSALWKWFPPVERMDPTSIVPSSIQADLRNHLTNDARATSRTFFASLGMSCRPVGSDMECKGAIPAYYICEHFEPRPDDRNVRHEGDLRITVWVSDSNIIKGARAALVSRGASHCPQRKWP